MTRPTCPVCQRPLKKKIESISFSPATANRVANGTRNQYGTTIYLDDELRPKNAEECQRYTNHEIVKVSMRHDGESVHSFSWWEGKYETRYGHFCTVTCAAKQGQASADHGHCYTWGKKS